MYHYYFLFLAPIEHLPGYQTRKDDPSLNHWSLLFVSESVGLSLVLTSGSLNSNYLQKWDPALPQIVLRHCAGESLHHRVQHLCALRHRHNACYVYSIKRQNQHHSYTDDSVPRNTMKRQRCTVVLAWTPQNSHWRISISQASWEVVTNSVKVNFEQFSDLFYSNVKLTDHRER